MNNRELKFRVWITDWGNSISRLEYIKEGFNHVYFGNWERGGYRNAIFQQFTGLKDKTGREVYEGDILKVKSYDGWSDKTSFYYNAEVFYCCCLARFRYTARVRDYISGTDLCPESEIEVIGNIFENTDLLK